MKFLSIFAAILIPLDALAIVPHQISQQPDPNHISIKFPPTPNRQPPKSTNDGGRRSISCTAKNTQTPLTALMPVDRIGTTVAPNPTLFLYVPETTAQLADLVILDSKGNFIYSKKLTLPEEPGILSLRLPVTVSLELNQSYLWKFSLICDSNDRSRDEFVLGTLERLQPSEEEQQKLAKANNAIEKATLYAKFHLWNETLSIVAQLRDTHPNEWKELLNSVGIQDEKIVEAPFVETLDQ